MNFNYPQFNKAKSDHTASSPWPLIYWIYSGIPIIAHPVAYYMLTAQTQKSLTGNSEACNTLILLVFLVAGVGFEPTTFRLWAWRATGLLHPAPPNWKARIRVSKIKKATGPLPDRPLLKKWMGYFLVTTSSCACCNAWRRPTLPCLKTKYHRRYLVSRPSSRWDRVGHRRYGHQAMKQAHKL